MIAFIRDALRYRWLRRTLLIVELNGREPRQADYDNFDQITDQQMKRSKHEQHT